METATPAGGVRARNWVAFATGVRCWVQPAKPSVVAQYGARSIVVDTTVYFYSDPMAALPAGKATENVRVCFTRKGKTRYFSCRGVQNVAEVDEVWALHAYEMRA